MGITTVAIFSDADRKSPHVRHADVAIHIGPSKAAESYLNSDKIIEACKQVDADAIHPGYGFLSENHVFAKKVSKAGIIFIGPSAKSIEIMGDKLRAKEAVLKYGVPLVSGTEKAVTSREKAMEVGEEIGYPLLIKASAGGGGKGMRIVESSDDLTAQLERAMSEAYSAFGDRSVFIEKYIESPRHIEFQILGDKYGNIIHVFERECSIQRRHQKVIEEAPSTVLASEKREEMGAAAVKVAKACEYHGAGTVEFLYDKNDNFYFLEMNTRLQVEHPVTELITGIDLVKEQIKIAEGQKLTLDQKNLKINGHAIEARVYAEDPENDFLPDTGKLITYRRPQGPGIRLDDGYEEGMDIPIHYDPMIAKLVSHGSNREEAISRILRAIDDYVISGVKTTLDFCRFAIDHSAFRMGQFNTNFVKNFYPADIEDTEPDNLEMKVATILGLEILNKDRRDNQAAPVKKERGKAWRNRLKY